MFSFSSGASGQAAKRLRGESPLAVGANIFGPHPNDRTHPVAATPEVCSAAGPVLRPSPANYHCRLPTSHWSACRKLDYRLLKHAQNREPPMRIFTRYGEVLLAALTYSNVLFAYIPPV